MAFIGSVIRPGRGLLLPGGMPAINPNTPMPSLLAGLVGCWVATGEGGAVSVIRDLVWNSNLTATSTNAVVASSVGMQAQDANLGGWTGTSRNTVQRPINAVSVLWFGSLYAAAVDGFLFGNSSATVNHYVLERAASGGMTFSVNDGTSSLDFTNAGFFDSTSSGKYCVLATYAVGGTAYVYKNGRLFNSGAASANAMAPETTLRVGNNRPGGTRTRAGMCLALAWNRQLNPGESEWISANPSGLLSFPGDLLTRQLWGAAVSPASQFQLFRGFP